MALDRDFEKYLGGPTVSTRERMHVTLSALGVLYMNANTHRLLGNGAAVALYYSSKQDVITIEPASPRIDEHFPVKPMSGGNGWRILLGPFLGNYKIRTDVTLKFVKPDIENGILLLSMRSTVNVTSRRYKSRK
jgi:hypothetical protein